METTKKIIYKLNANLPFFILSSNTIQLGWQPETALLLQIPLSYKLTDVLSVIESWRTEIILDKITDPFYYFLATKLIETNLISPTLSDTNSTFKIRIHGNGPLSDGLIKALSTRNIKINNSSQRTRNRSICDWQENLVILTDNFIIDPAIQLGLMKFKIPHLTIRIRDTVSVIGPLVLPGYTSCLNCAHIYNTNKNANWPLIAAQLLNKTPNSPTELVTTTIGIVTAQIFDLIKIFHIKPPEAQLPELANTTYEISFNPIKILKREWEYQTKCGCCSESLIPI